MRSLKAVFFDFDGTIAHTSKINFEAWSKAFSTIGLTLDEKSYYLEEGTSPIEVVKKFSGLGNSDAEKIALLKEKNYETSIVNKKVLYDHVKSILKFLKLTKIPTALVSGSTRERINKTLDHETLNNFDCIISSSDVKTNKPSPEPYLVASRKLNVYPNECMVVENAPLGIDSAKAANMFCVAIESTLNSEDLKQANLILKNHLELYNFLKKTFS